MTDKTDTGESTVGNVVASEARATGSAATVAVDSSSWYPPPEPRSDDAPPKETWRDWMPPGSPEPARVFTRRDFLNRLNAKAIDVSPTTLSYWENQRIIPRGEKRWINGTPHSVYPEWMITMLRIVRELQDDGVGLQEIRRTLRLIPWFRPDEVIDQVRPGDEARDALIETFERTAHDVIRPLLLEHARMYERLTGSRVMRIELQMIDAKGERYREGYG